MALALLAQTLYPDLLRTLFAVDTTWSGRSDGVPGGRLDTAPWAVTGRRDRAGGP